MCLKGFNNRKCGVSLLYKEAHYAVLFHAYHGAKLVRAVLSQMIFCNTSEMIKMI